MDSLLVISEEPSLPETLISELPGIAIEHVRFLEAAAALSEDRHRLIIVDDAGNANAVTDTGKTPVVRLTRPIRLSELLYTIRGALQGKSAAGREELMLFEEYRFSPSERLVRATDGSVRIALTEKEAGLLQCLLEAAGKIVSRDILLKKVWGYSDDIATHTLETHIYRLRGKLRQTSESLDIISSEEGGYLLKT
jgi:hypothetical protein